MPTKDPVAPFNFGREMATIKDCLDKLEGDRSILIRYLEYIDQSIKTINRSIGRIEAYGRLQGMYGSDHVDGDRGRDADPDRRADNEERRPRPLRDDGGDEPGEQPDDRAVGERAEPASGSGGSSVNLPGAESRLIPKAIQRMHETECGVQAAHGDDACTYPRGHEYNHSWESEVDFSARQAFETAAAREREKAKAQATDKTALEKARTAWQ
jgi:hypothetical protein